MKKWKNNFALMLLVTAVCFLVPGLVYGRFAYRLALEFVNLNNDNETFRLFAFTFFSVAASFLLSVSVSLFVVGISNWIITKTRKSESTKMKRKDFLSRSVSPFVLY